MKTLGRYDLQGELGRGAMGIVYRGLDPIIGRTVAIKCLHPHIIEGQEEARRRFQQEILALGKLEHPNIVTIYDAGKDQGFDYIVMEYVEGITLSHWLKSGEAIPVGAVLRIGVQICQALHFAHSHGVIHRDIKPGNILLSGNQMHAKVTDFGIAQMEGTGHTHTDRLLGTPQYMSPEQYREATLDGRSDLFSVAALLYEMLTQRKAFGGESVPVIMHRVLKDIPPAPVTLQSTIPWRLSDVVMRGLEKDPSRRFPSAEEMARALEASAPGLLPDAPIDAPIDAPTDAPTVVVPDTPRDGLGKDARTAGRSRWVARASLAGAALAVTGGIAVVWYMQRPPAPSVAPVSTMVPMTVATQGAGPQAGQVTFSTTPPGAQIFIDGAMTGVSPLTLALPAGAHEMRIFKGGYHPIEATLEIPVGKMTPVNLILREEEML